MYPTFEPDSVYFASGAYGSTVAKAALQSPQKARDIIDGVTTYESSSLRFGTVWDTFLTGDRNNIIDRPLSYTNDKGEVKPWNANSNVCKAWMAANADKLIIGQEDNDRIARMWERMPGLIKDIIEGGQRQAVFRVDQGNFMAQCKVDVFAADSIEDVKTTSKPIEDFAAQAIKYGYHVQAGWYRWIIQELTGRLTPFNFIVTETVSPYRTVRFEPDGDWLAYGDAEAFRSIEILSHCCQNNQWHDTKPITQTLTLPKWA